MRRSLLLVMSLGFACLYSSDYIKINVKKRGWPSEGSTVIKAEWNSRSVMGSRSSEPLHFQTAPLQGQPERVRVFSLRGEALGCIKELSLNKCSRSSSSLIHYKSSCFIFLCLWASTAHLDLSWLTAGSSSSKTDLIWYCASEGTSIFLFRFIHVMTMFAPKHKVWSWSRTKTYSGQTFSCMYHVQNVSI